MPAMQAGLAAVAGISGPVGRQGLAELRQQKGKVLIGLPLPQGIGQEVQLFL